MPPNKQPIVNWVEQALEQGLEVMETLLVGYLYSHLGQPCDWRKEELATTITNYSVEDQTLNFIPRRKYRGEGAGNG